MLVKLYGQVLSWQHKLLICCHGFGQNKSFYYFLGIEQTGRYSSLSDNHGRGFSVNVLAVLRLTTCCFNLLLFTDFDFDFLDKCIISCSMWFPCPYRPFPIKYGTKHQCLINMQSGLDCSWAAWAFWYLLKVTKDFSYQESSRPEQENLMHLTSRWASTNPEQKEWHALAQDMRIQPEAFPFLYCFSFIYLNSSMCKEGIVKDHEGICC